jgi:hypothetical protein
MQNEKLRKAVRSDYSVLEAALRKLMGTADEVLLTREGTDSEKPQAVPYVEVIDVDVTPLTFSPALNQTS